MLSGCLLAMITGAAADAALNARIDANIARYRQSEVTIEVVDAAGRPVPDAQVEVSQTSHAFLFGCNAFVLGQLEPAELEARYEAAFRKLFNFATMPLYWAGTEPTEGELRYADPCRDIWRRPPGDRFVAWAKQTGLVLKGHPLLWHAHNPGWIPKDPDKLKALYVKRFHELADRFGADVPIWDVVNESQVCPEKYPLYTPDKAYVGWAFDQAVPLFPADSVMMINEVTRYNFIPAARNPYVQQIRELLAAGKDVRGIGLQYHFFRREALDKHLATPQSDLGSQLDLYEALAEFKLPLYITEITIPSAGDGGKELQEQMVTDLYRLWFSAPTMAGITWWNLGDGTAIKGENEAEGGLMDERLQPKPAYLALDKLINQDWTTKATVTTDANGKAKLRGFHGGYQVTVKAGGRETEEACELVAGEGNHWTMRR